MNEIDIVSFFFLRKKMNEWMILPTVAFLDCGIIPGKKKKKVHIIHNLKERNRCIN